MTDLETSLQTENERLKAELKVLQDEHKLVVATIIKTLGSIGLWPINPEDNLASKAIKAVSRIAADAMLNPSGLEKRFSFIKNIYPLCEKYKDFQIEDNGE